MTSKTEEKLFSITSELESVETKQDETNSSEQSETTISYPMVASVEVIEEDIIDLKKKNQLIIPLTDIDYLILTDYSLGNTPDTICQKHNITKSKLNTLLRNPKAIELIEELTENTRKKSLATATALENKGIELLSTMVNTNIEAGNYDTAVKLLFGKLSLTEVTERIAKRNDKEETNNNIQINNLFGELSGR